MYNDNPVQEFCENMARRSRLHGWTDKTYQEMIDRLCYLIDHSKSLKRIAFAEPINMEREIIYFELQGRRVPVAGTVRSSPLWGEAEYLLLDSDHYLVNIHTNEEDQWTFAGRRVVPDCINYPLLIRTPYITTIGRELDFSIKFFEPTPVEDDDYHTDCLNHFFNTYANTSVIEGNIFGEFNELQINYGRPA